MANMEEDDQNDDGNHLNDAMLQLMAESDVLNNTLEASKEAIESRVNQIESDITKDITVDWTNTQTRILDEQHHRNRTIVKEIIKTCAKFKTEICKYLLNCLLTKDLYSQGSRRDRKQNQ